MRIRNILRSLVWLCLIFALFTGCAPKEDLSIVDNQVWETMPSLTYGQLEYEKLKVEPWYCGRTEAVSKNRYAETENGFYSYAGNLRYIDKVDPVAWVPLCNKPNCMHPENSPNCNAYPGFGGTFVIRNARIYISAQMNKFPELCPEEYRESGSLAIFSKAMNGTDMRLEYVINDEASKLNGAGGYTNMLNSHCWLCNIFKLNPDGSYTATSYCLSSNGLEILFQDNFDNQSDAQATFEVFRSPFCGDPVFYNSALGNKLYGILNGEVYEVDAAKYADGGGYLSGNTLRQFCINEGYYDIDLETGNAVLVSENRLQNSRSFILLPNCIIETTLGSAEHPEGTEQVMEIFDGESWRTVQLPEELLHAASSKPFYVQVISSDRILFTTREQSRTILYQVMLGGKDLVMEYYGQLSE